MFFLSIYMLISVLRWGYVCWNFKIKRLNKASILDFLVVVSQVIVGASLERSYSILNDFGFILVLLALVESVYFRIYLNKV